MRPGSGAGPRACPSCVVRAATRRPSGSLRLEALPPCLNVADGSLQLRAFRRGMMDQGGHLVVSAPVESSARHNLLRAAPLLEEERDAGAATPGTHVAHPARLHRPGTWSAFPAHDDPGDPGKLQGT